MKRTILIALMLCGACAAGYGRRLERVTPEQAGLDPRHMVYADSVIVRAIDDGTIPGAVLAVVRNGKMAWLKAYGNRQIVPDTAKMTEETIFDMASCTKPVATATAAMILVERGVLRLLDPVSDFIPEFKDWRGSNGRRTVIRIGDLMTHTSGLPAYVLPAKLEREYGEATRASLLKYICTCDREFEPRTSFRYSCLNYITLQHIIEKATGMSLRDFARTEIFEPLGMEHTDYIPCAQDAAGFWYPASPPRWAVDGEQPLENVASTERLQNGQVLCGTVQDPLARIPMGGVSGNAGLFSTADDLALFCAAMLGGGELDGVRILGPKTVETLMRVPRSTADIGRTPAWDAFTPYSSAGGDLFGERTLSHTGHTGTSIVLDPESGTAVILLTNVVHPVDDHTVVRLRSLVANIAAASVRNAE